MGRLRNSEVIPCCCVRADVDLGGIIPRVDVAACRCAPGGSPRVGAADAKNIVGSRKVPVWPDWRDRRPIPSLPNHVCSLDKMDALSG